MSQELLEKMNSIEAKLDKLLSKKGTIITLAEFARKNKIHYNTAVKRYSDRIVMRNDVRCIEE